MRENVSWNQIRNWWPVLVGTVLVMLSYTAVIARIAVVETKLDNVIAMLESYERRQTTILSNLNDVNKRLIVVEVEYNLRR